MKVDIDLLKKFENGLEPSRPEASKIPARVLGYGEISTVFAIEGQDKLACKRMPIFQCQEELDQYQVIYDEYNRLLKGEVGIEVPPYDCVAFDTNRGYIVCFDVQERQSSESFGNRAIHILSEDEITVLVRLILKNLLKIWEFNRKNKSLQLGIDGQISNWVIRGFKPDKPQVGPTAKLFYIDTSTPFIRKDGVEQLNPELFMRSAPSFLRWLIRWLFLKDVMTRYYDFHLVAVDLIANFYKEQRPELIPALVEVANDFFDTEAKELNITPITVKEVESYYKEDAIIWTVFLALRRFDRFLHKWILRRPYVYILPGKIKR
ncbi:MAG: hypothetical protein FJ008_05350 [Chloroflexi bacterium]|nr:hypothetical protein [Chloroflexota bacterium]MBM3166800.1 hypothetical protein [Chloroflexota bacterium]MBM4452439.1 hypothetical protein [Chloroflexota bacterium]